VIYEYEEPWQDDIDREEFLTLPPELSGNPISSRLVAKQEELAKKMINSAFRSISFIL
jgi:hypothetical protein